MVAMVCAVWALFASVPGRAALQAMGDMSQATTLYDVNNRPVFTIFKEYRVEVPLSRMSPYLRTAILAIEDQRFAEHRGVDLVRIAAAAWADLREGRRAQGGSTITQQLARQAFLDREKTIGRKLKEVALALRIERMYSKDEILELYLNKVYFGDGLHGAEAAARGYFGISASELSLSQAALLAGLVNAPSTTAPTVSLLRATARLAPDEIRVELFAGIGQLPLFNPELEATMPAPVRALHARIDSSDALLIASPEYAHGVTGTLKNALDWLVSHEGFVDKRVAIFNASPRSVHADAQLREILTTMSATLVADACLALPLRGTGITEQGILESGHAADIRRALTLLVSGAPRA